MSEKLSLLHKIRENKNRKESTSFNEIVMRFIGNWKWFVLGTFGGIGALSNAITHSD